MINNSITTYLSIFDTKSITFFFIVKTINNSITSCLFYFNKIHHVSFSSHFSRYDPDDLSRQFTKKGKFKIHPTPYILINFFSSFFFSFFSPPSFHRKNKKDKNEVRKKNCFSSFILMLLYF